jgi:hypothetical protein
MSITSVPEEAPYTPAGDLADVFAGLDDLDVYEVRDQSVDEGSVLPELDDALAELAATVDAPAGTAPDDATVGGDEHVDAADESGSGGLTRERAVFEEVQENTDVDSIPDENAAAFLANTLYAVPPANTRFEWVAVEDLTPDWDLDVDW